MDKIERENPVRAASHANLSFGEIMSMGESAVQSVASSIKNHPRVSAVIAAETIAAVGVAVVTHGHSVKETAKLAGLETEIEATSGAESRAAYAKWRSAFYDKQSTDMYKHAMIGVAASGALYQIPVMAALTDNTQFKSASSEKPCLENSSERAHRDLEQKRAIKMPEFKTTRFSTSEKC